MANEIIQLLTVTTLAMTLSLLLVLAIRMSLRQLFGARVAYLAWCLVPLAMLAVLLPAPVREVTTLTRGTLAAVGMVPLQLLTTERAVISLPDYRFWLPLLWSCGVVVAALLFQRMQCRYLRALGELRPAGEGVFVSQSADACPAVVGAWKPRIVLPADFEIRYPAREGEMVMAHERAHLHRGDAVVNLAVVALRSVYWFNPLLHWASTRFRQDQEMACDAMVLGRFPDRRRSYAEAMLKTQLAVLGLPVGCHWQSSQSLKERIVMLKQPLPGRLRRRTGAMLVTIAACACSYGAWALQPDNLVKPPAMIGSAVVGQPALDGEGVYRYAHGSAMYAPMLTISGEAVLLLSIDAAGEIQGVEVEDVKPAGALDKAMAKRMVSNSRFSPKVVNGRAVSSLVRMPMAFGPTPPPLSAEQTLTYSGNVITKLASGASDVIPDRPVEIKDAPPPAYPIDALSRKQDGKVVLIVDVGADGSVTKAQIDSSNPPTVFDAAALEAVRKWKFTPAMEQGKAVPGKVQIPITFEADAKADGAVVGPGSGKQYVWHRDAVQPPIRETSCDVMRVSHDDNTGDISDMECGITAATEGK